MNRPHKHPFWPDRSGTAFSGREASAFPPASTSSKSSGFVAPRARYVLMLGAVLMFGLLVMLGLLTQRSFARLNAANDWSLHTYKVLAQIDRISQVLDAHEAQLRGFALTGETKYLAQLRESELEGEQALREVRLLTADRVLQQKRLDALEPAITGYNRRFLEPFLSSPSASDMSIAQRRDLAGAQTAPRSQYVAALQNDLHRMEASERRLIAKRAAELKLAQEGAGHSFIFVSLFTVLLAGGLLTIVARSSSEKNRSAIQLKVLNDSLKTEVAERRTVEESLRASEAGFRHLAEDSLDLICRHAPDGTLTYVSAAAFPVLGYAPIEMTGVHFWRFLVEAPTLAPNVTPQQGFGATLDATHIKPLLQKFRSKSGQEIWMEIVGHAIVDPESGQVRAWHTTSRDVSARVHDDRDRARLLDGLRAIVNITDQLIAAPDEETLLQRAVESARARLGLERCSIYLTTPGNAALMRGTWGTDENGVAVREDDLLHDTRAEHDPDDAMPGPGERWIVRHNQIRHCWKRGVRIELPGTGWIARTLIATRQDTIGLFFHDGTPGDKAHDHVEQELVAVFCSLLGALIESVRVHKSMVSQQKLLQTVVENAPLFLYSVDKNETFTVATGKVFPKIGFDPPAMINASIDEVAGKYPVPLAAIRRALRGEFIEQEMPFAGYWLKMWRQPLYDAAGEISGMIGVGMDITEQHQSEIELRASENRYRQVADSLQEVLFQTDADDCWSFLNPAWHEITGFPVESTLGTRAINALHSDDRHEFQTLIESARSVHKTDETPRILRFLTRTGACCKTDGRCEEVQAGEVRWIEIALRANFDAERGFVGTVGTLSDVTQRVRAEHALHETLEMQRAILQSATYAIVATNAHGIIQSFNPAAETLFGVAANEVVGRAQPTIFHDRAELEARAAQFSQEWGELVAPGFETLVAQAHRNGGSDENQWTCLRADGTRFPMRISHAVLHSGDGTIAGYVSIGYDLTETRRAQKLKDEFVSVVSHELRTPLTSIRGALGLLSGGIAGQLPPAAGQMIEIAEKNADRLVLLINDILDIEKIASGKMRFEMAEVSLPDLLRGALESNRGYAQTLGVDLKLEPMAPELKRATLNGDEARLQQVLSNLLSNACKWTPGGGEVRLRARLQREGNVRIEVQDAGPGVPPEFESRLFERFAQADGSATRGKGGTGLGLAVTRAIIEKHGGQIGYLAPDEVAGRRGATFYFELKAEHPAPQLEIPEPHLNSQPSRGRMLVVEDDADVAALLQAILEDAGYAVEVAASGAEALRCVEKGLPFSGATLDLNLPDCKGLELVEQLHQIPATRALPVVVVSSFCAEEQKHSRPDQIKKWLGKPVEPEMLLQAVSGLNGCRERVLHVEDDADVRRVTELILGDSAEIVTAATLSQARARLQNQRFDLVILDIGLPDGNGLELLEELSAQDQPVPVVLFSAREEEAETASNVAAALVKSRTPNAALRAKVEELLDKRSDCAV